MKLGKKNKVAEAAELLRSNSEIPKEVIQFMYQATVEKLDQIAK